MFFIVQVCNQIALVRMSLRKNQDKKKEAISVLNEFDDIDKEFAELGLNFPETTSASSDGIKTNLHEVSPATVASEVDMHMNVKLENSEKDEDLLQLGIAYCTDPHQLLVATAPQDMLKSLANGMKELVRSGDPEQVKAVKACDSFLGIRAKSV